MPFHLPLRQLAGPSGNLEESAIEVLRPGVGTLPVAGEECEQASGVFDYVPRRGYDTENAPRMIRPQSGEDTGPRNGEW